MVLIVEDEAPLRQLVARVLSRAGQPAIMILMGMFVAFVLIALYLPIFSLADAIR